MDFIKKFDKGDWKNPCFQFFKSQRVLLERTQFLINYVSVLKKTYTNKV